MRHPRHHRFAQTTASAVVALALTASLATLVAAPTVAAPAGPDQMVHRVDAVRSSSASVPTTRRHEGTGKLGFIGTRAGRPIDSGFSATAAPGKVARSFLAGRAGSLGLRDSTLRVTQTRATPGGGTAVRLQQSYAGVPVLGGEFAVHLDDENDVLSVLGEASPITEASTRPTVAARAAERTARGSVAKHVAVEPSSLRAEPARLMMYDARLLDAPSVHQAARLSWVTEVRGRASATDIGRLVVVDAETGTVALEIDTIAHAQDRRVCDADNATAHLPCTAPVWTEGDTPDGVDEDVRLAYQYAGDTYDFFADRFGLDSLDGAGMPLISTVDYCDPDEDCPYENAFWNGDQMVYGDGFASADDVVGHELAHGVTEFSSGLYYFRQSGAINESMSDIFGELIDQVNGAGSDADEDRWLVGEDVPGIGAIRDMADPPAFDQPDRMTSPLYWGSASDSGGVHFNSGVGNKAAFLMADGGTFNGQTISALGPVKTARIFFTVNDSMLVSGSDYADLANALRQACTNLIGTDAITAADCVEVGKVVQATEMDQNPTTAPTTTAEVCPTGTERVSTVLSEDFESGFARWSTGTIAGTNGWSSATGYATSGDTVLYGRNLATRTDSFARMSTAVTVPADAYLHFNHAYAFEEDTSGSYDGGVLEYTTDGGATWTDAGALMAAPAGAGGYTGTVDNRYGNPLGGRSGFVRESNGFGSTRVALTSLAGQEVAFRWRIGTDSDYAALGWLLDDVSIGTCAAPPPDTSITSGPTGVTAAATPTFGFTATTEDATFECQVDAGPWAACTSPHTTPLLGDGPHTFAVRATGANGRTDPTPASRSFAVDTVAPQVSLTDGPTSPTTNHTPTFSFVSTEAGSTFECRVDGGPWVPCTSPHTTAWLPDGDHTFDVRAVDAAGNVDPTPQSQTFTVSTPPPPDTTAPETTITAGPGGVTSNPRPVLEFVSSETGSTFECRVDGGAWTTCASPHTTPRLPDGSHTVEVRATDAAGNTDLSPAARRFRVDTTAPETTITVKPAKRTGKRVARFAFVADEPGATFQCRLDRRSWRPCTTATTYQRLGAGRHVFRVRAVDAVGNVESAPAVWAWRIRR